MVTITDEEWRIISDVFGWIYFFAWSISFYPQIAVNYKLKSVEGLQLDYPFLNMSGYIFYSICYSIGYFGKNNPYHNYGFHTVRIQDLVFALHGLVMSAVTGYQCIFYYRGKNKLSRYAIGYTIFVWVFALTVFLLTTVSHLIPSSENFNIVLYCGYLKLSISMVKYIPAIYWNYTRKSTEGFSISGVMLDLSGGVFSVAQNIIDVVDGTSLAINPVKFGLGNATLIYDFILMYQHFVLYRKSSRNGTKKMLDSNTVEPQQDYRQLSEEC